MPLLYVLNFDKTKLTTTEQINEPIDQDQLMQVLLNLPELSRAFALLANTGKEHAHTGIVDLATLGLAVTILLFCWEKQAGLKQEQAFIELAAFVTVLGEVSNEQILQQAGTLLKGGVLALADFPAIPRLYQQAMTAPWVILDACIVSLSVTVLERAVKAPADAEKYTKLHQELDRLIKIIVRLRMQLIAQNNFTEPTTTTVDHTVLYQYLKLPYQQLSEVEAVYQQLSHGIMLPKENRDNVVKANRVRQASAATSLEPEKVAEMIDPVAFGNTGLANNLNVGVRHKQSLSMANPNKLLGLLVPFIDQSGGIISAAAQAQRILVAIQQRLTAGARGVAITYSANNEQAEKLYKGYHDDQFNQGVNALSGGNQAEVFALIQQAILRHSWQQQVHILPVATSRYGGNDEQLLPDGTTNLATRAMVERDMQNIAYHLGAGWDVLGLQNQQIQRADQFSIGGGYSIGWHKPGVGQGAVAAALLANMARGDFSDPVLQTAYLVGLQTIENSQELPSTVVVTVATSSVDQQARLENISSVPTAAILAEDTARGSIAQVTEVESGASGIIVPSSILSSITTENTEELKAKLNSAVITPVVAPAVTTRTKLSEHNLKIEVTPVPGEQPQFKINMWRETDIGPEEFTWISTGKESETLVIPGWNCAKLKLDINGTLHLTGKWPNDYRYTFVTTGDCYIEELFSKSKININAANIYNHQELWAKEAVNLVATGKIINRTADTKDQAQLHTAGKLSLKATGLDNQGSKIKGGEVVLELHGGAGTINLINDHGKISGKQGLTIVADGIKSSNGVFKSSTADITLTVTGEVIVNGDGIIQAEHGGINILAKKVLAYQASHLFGKELKIVAESLRVSQPLEVDEIDFTVAEDLMLPFITARKGLTIQFNGTSWPRYGTIHSNGSIAISHPNSRLKLEHPITAAGQINLMGQEIVHWADITSYAGGIKLTTTKRDIQYSLNSKGNLQAAQDITCTGQGLLQEGKLQTNGDVSFKLTNLSLQQEVACGGNFECIVAGTIIQAAIAKIEVGKEMHIQVVEPLEINAGIIANGKINIAVTTDNVLPITNAQGNGTAALVTRAALISNTCDLSISAQMFINYNEWGAPQGSIHVKTRWAWQEYSCNQGTISCAKDFKLDTAALSLLAGTVKVGGDLVITPAATLGTHLTIHAPCEVRGNFTSSNLVSFDYLANIIKVNGCLAIHFMQAMTLAAEINTPGDINFNSDGKLSLLAPITANSKINLQAPEIMLAAELIARTGIEIITSSAIASGYTITNTGSIKTAAGNISILGQGINSLGGINSGQNILCEVQYANLLGQCSAKDKIKLMVLAGGIALQYTPTTFMAADLEIIRNDGFSLTVPLNNPGGNLSLTINDGATANLQVLAPIKATGDVVVKVPVRDAGPQLIIGQVNSLQEITAGGKLCMMASLIDNQWGKIFGQGVVELIAKAEILNGTAIVAKKIYSGGSYTFSFEDNFYSSNGAIVASGNNCKITCTTLKNQHGDIYVTGNWDVTGIVKIVNISGEMCCERDADFSNTIIENRTLFDASSLEHWGHVPFSYPYQQMVWVREIFNKPAAKIASILVKGDAIFLNLENYYGTVYIAGKDVHLKEYLNPPLVSTSQMWGNPYTPEVGSKYYTKSIIKINICWAEFQKQPATPNSCVRHYDHVDMTTGTHQGVVSAGKSLTITAKTLTLLEVLSAPQMVIANFTHAVIGITDTRVKLQPAKPFQQVNPLLDYYRPSGMLKVTKPGTSPTVMALTIPISTCNIANLPPITIIYPEGFSTNSKNLRPFFPVQKEMQYITQVFMQQLKRGYLDPAHTTPEQIYYKLRFEAYQLGQRYLASSNSSSTALTLIHHQALKYAAAPVLLYQEIEYESEYGRETVLPPVVWLPASYDDPRARDGAGLLYGNKIYLLGDKQAASKLHITAHIQATEQLVLSANEGLIEKRQHVYQQTVTDTSTTKNWRGKKKTHSETRTVTCRSAEPGAEIITKEFIYDFDKLEVAGAKLVIGEGGSKGRITDTAIIRPVIDVSYQQVSGGAKSLLKSSSSTVNLARYTIIPTSIFSLAHITQEADNTQTLCALQALAYGRLLFSARNGLTILPAVVTEELAPVHTAKKFSHAVTTGSMQRAVPTELVSLNDKVELTSSNGAITTTALKAYGKTGIDELGASVTNDTLVLQQHQATSASGIAGFTAYKTKQTESHQTTMQPELSSTGPIRIIAATGDNVQIGLRAKTTDVLEITAAHGRVKILEQQLQHSIVIKTYSIGIEFFGSKALEASMQGDFQRASKALLREFPLLAALEDLGHSRDTADQFSNSIKTLYHAYQTYKRFAEAKNLTEFIKGEINFDPKLRFGVLSKLSHINFNILNDNSI